MLAISNWPALCIGRFCNNSLDYSLNCTPLSPMTISNCEFLLKNVVSFAVYLSFA